MTWQSKQIQGDYLNEVHEYIRALYHMALIPGNKVKDREVDLVLDLFYSNVAQHLPMGSTRQELLERYLSWATTMMGA